MMQLLASDGVRSIMIIHEQGIDGIKVILHMIVPRQQYASCIDFFSKRKV